MRSQQQKNPPPYDPALYPPPNATRAAELALARKERLERERQESTRKDLDGDV